MYQLSSLYRFEIITYKSTNVSAESMISIPKIINFNIFHYYALNQFMDHLYYTLDNDISNPVGTLLRRWKSNSIIASKISDCVTVSNTVFVRGDSFSSGL